MIFFFIYEPQTGLTYLQLSIVKIADWLIKMHANLATVLYIEHCRFSGFKHESKCILKGVILFEYAILVEICHASNIFFQNTFDSMPDT